MSHDLPDVIVTERLTLARRGEDERSGVGFAVRTTREGLDIGTAHVAPLDAGDWSVGLSIREDDRRRGYGHEAARALLGVVFSELGAARALVAVPLDSDAGQRLAERLGMNGQGVHAGARRYLAWRAPGATPPQRGRRR